MRRSIDEKKDGLIRDLADARQEVLVVVRALPADAVDVVFLGEWSAHDIVAHLAGWDYSNANAIKAVMAGRLPDFYEYYDADWRTYNAGLVRRYKQPVIAETIETACVSHAALCALLESIPADDIIGDHGVRSPRGRHVTVAMLLQAEAGDERKHAKQVAAFAARLPVA